VVRGLLYIHVHKNISRNLLAAHIYTQTVHPIQQYITHLHTNRTHNTAVDHTFTHKQYTQYSISRLYNFFLTCVVDCTTKHITVWAATTSVICLCLQNSLGGILKKLCYQSSPIFSSSVWAVAGRNVNGISRQISCNTFHAMALFCATSYWESLKLTLKYVGNFLIYVGYYNTEFYVMRYSHVFYKSAATRKTGIY
jgi:hypothetical protein